jgi:hypothetical protein
MPALIMDGDMRNSETICKKDKPQGRTCEDEWYPAEKKNNNSTNETSSAGWLLSVMLTSKQTSTTHRQPPSRVWQWK